MRLKSFLPVAFALPAVSAPSTPNDLLRQLALQAPKQDDGPVCCLRPLMPPEAPEEDVLLSFEEWKERQMASILREQHLSPTQPLPSLQTHAGVPARNASSDPIPPTNPPGDNQSTQPAETVEAPVPDAPYFRIPITDRFNYASIDCSARVHTAHKSAKSPAAILASKKDRYMLSPCNEKNQFVVVELCDDIRIDTVQLANYEFFSGVFKDFTVSVAKTYNGEWVTAGTYRAENTRGVQSFHPPTTLGDFYRFVRIDFHSHYGNEYYCPLSLFRVYGLTHLEHWKWDLWESESKAKRALEESAPAAESASGPPAPVEGTEPQKHVAEVDPSSCTSCGSSAVGYAPTAVSQADSESNNDPGSADTTLTTQIADTEHAEAYLTATEHSGTTTSPSQTAISSSTGGSDPIDKTADNNPLPPSQQSLTLDTSNDSERQHITDSLYNTHALSSSTGPASHSVSLSLSSPASAVSAHGSSSSPTSHSSSVTSSVSFNQPAHSNRSSSPSSSTASTTLSQSLVVVTPSIPSTNGESIYRTIMNRLTALETNTSLYARFVEDHTANVREMLRKLSEEVGRLEGLGKAQAQSYQRTVLQFERQQRRIELEHSDLLQRVSRLTDEVILEKRLGIAQLCLLLAVLVFMALTRGSRNEPVRTGESEGGSVRSRTDSLRGWGRRTLSFSGDWMNRFTSRSVSPPPTRVTESKSQEHKKALNLTIRTGPTQDVQVDGAFPRYKRAHLSPAGRRLGGIMVRPRTPTTARSHTSRINSPLHFPTTPTRAAQMTAPLSRTGPRERPTIQRSYSNAMTQSYSMGMIPPGPKSAKHWARTAHLHEVKNVGMRVYAGELEPSESSDVFSAGVDVPSSRENRVRRGDGVLGSMKAENQMNGRSERTLQLVEKTLEGDASEGDVWVDTDVEDDSGAELESLHDSVGDTSGREL